MKIVFIDKNIFLHFRSFDEINWLEICQTQSCKLVISPIVIDELDKFKLSNDDKGKRARKILNKIEDCTETNTFRIRNNVELEVLAERPSNNIFKSYHLNPEGQDNQLMACIIEYKIKRNENDVFLCTYDTGFKLRSKQYGIEIIKMPEKYLIPEKDTKIQKQMKALIRENELLKSRIPKPSVVFENEEKFIKIKVHEYDIDKNAFISKKLIEVKSKFPYMDLHDNDEKYLNPMIMALQSSLNTISDDQIKQYNSSLDSFYAKYADFLSILYKYEVKTNHCIRLKFFLTNEGNVPTEDVDIFFHFPNGFEIIEEDKFEEPPTEPTPPNTPKTFFENSAIRDSILNLRPYFPNLNSQQLPKLNRPSIKKTSSYDVHYKRESIKHGIKYQLDQLIAIYKDYVDMRSFTIDYKILANNVPVPIIGKLNIIFEK
jgi:rRNA-processing protein FCF1